MKKILIVDDDIISLKIMARIVEEMGHIAILSKNGIRGLYTLQDNPDISLIISDMQMPEMSGRELITTLRGIENLKDKPIILVTGTSTPEEIQDFIAIGIDGLIIKPIAKDALKKYINKALAKATI